MAEEEKKEETKVEKKVEEKTEETSAEAPAEAAAPQVNAADSKKVKVTAMTLDEVQKAIEKAEKEMGGFNSHYAQALLARKKVLTGS